MLLEKIDELLKEVSTLTAQNAEEVEQLRIKYLSKKGEINALMADFRTVPADQKKEVGVKINELKNAALEKINGLKEQMEEAEASSDDIDLTRTAYPVALGTRHPLTVVKNQIIDIFARMGFTLFQGPEVDDDKHVFTMLNFAADHPARDMQDTFFIEKTNSDDVTKNVLLRSHTSGDEAHYMETHEPPIRVLCPGRVYRNEAISYRAHAFFHQVEALFIDRNVSFTDLKQALLLFAQEMFGKDTKIRLRPSYFPFTEPSAEVDVMGKNGKWLEVLGCGMVHPNVLRNVGIDPEVYSGFAFGMGMERLTMLRYGVTDLRSFFENDLRFLKQFK